jgi:MATE family multidrug resistance protein
VRVIETGVPLLFAAAAFQLFDGTQVVSTGSLRGLGDTRTPFYANITGYWVLGLPIGMFLCFRMGWEVLGLWIGLSIGLMIVAVVLLTRWVWASRVPSEAR